jgi:cytoskeletal protein RodZ
VVNYWRQNIGSKETAMPTRRFERIALAQLLMVGCAVVLSACVLIKHAQAQFVNPPPPPPPPVFNPSSPNTVPQPSYKPLTPSTPSTTPSTPSTVPSGEVTSPGNEEPPSTTARSERRASFEKTRSVHHHRARATPVTYRCGYLGCVRTYAWAFPCQYYSTYCPYGYYRYGW